MPPAVDPAKVINKPKVPYPRQLTKKETLDSLSHWQTSVRNYYRRFDEYAEFFKRTSTWTTARNYGFTGQNVEDRADNLECLLDSLASFLPGPYLTHRITQTTTSVQSVWDIIWDHYGVKPSFSSFLDYDDLQYDKDDRYIDFYDKLIYHMQNHLCAKDTDAGPAAGGKLTADDQLTLTHRNHIAIDWMRKINPSLVRLVKLEYSKDLKSGVPLASLVREIAENIDSILHRHDKTSTRLVSLDPPLPTPQEEETNPPDPVVNRVSTFPFRPRLPSANYRGYQPRQSFPPRNPSFRPSFPSRFPSPQNKPFCQSCFNLGKKLSLTVDWSHPQNSCPQNSSVRHVQEHEEPETDATAFQGDSNDNSILNTDPNNCVDHMAQNTAPTNCFQNQNSPPTTSSSTWMQDISAQVRKLETMRSSQVRREKSPTLGMILNSVSVFPTIDEGSEINVIDMDFANKCNINYSRTNHQATAAGSHKMMVVGETHEDIVLHKTVKKCFIRWNVKKCIVVRNLGCPILIGEPGKKDNFITTVPSKKLISCIDVNNVAIEIPYESKPVLYNRCFICRSACNLVIYPGEKVKVDIPTMLQSETSLIFSPRPQGSSPNLPNQTCEVQGNKVVLSNDSCSLINIVKNQHFGDLTPIVQKQNVSSSLQNDYMMETKPTNIFKTTSATKDFVNSATIDPDNILSPSWKQTFSDILQDYSDIITPVPGCYNGFYGNVDCSINFIQDPPASNKARLPGYSHDKLVEMAKIMDEMESFGVLKRPHDLGITPRNVHTSYLVPKIDGKYRFVTDFTSLLPFIGKLEVVSPSIAQAKRILSGFKYFVELDLSHCFWQGPMSAEDTRFLATPHPFGGLRVYAREPQGIRNASEHNSERLGTIFGDMEMDKRMTRMADGLYVGGETLDILVANLKEVFQRARNCGLTFKPSKIVICPISTILFGWKKNGNSWSPTSHVMSPLASSPPPKTVKQLRGWIGAYRQVAETIKDYSVTLSSLEKEVSGKKSRDEIKWSPSLLTDFNNAKLSLKSSQSITIPLPSDTLHIYPDFSQTANAVGGHLIIERHDKGGSQKLNGGYFSVRLSHSQIKWSPCERETLGIKLNIEHFKPFIQESLNTTIIHPDNIISVHAWNRLKRGIISSSSKVAAFLSSLSENNIDLKHCPGVDTKVADYNSRNPMYCDEKRCQICKYMNDQCTIGENCVNSVSVQDILAGTARLPLTEKPAWIQVQKEDDMHNRLFKLIRSGGLQPEPKLRGHMDLKLMYNLYKKGLLKIDSFGLIVVKHVDVSSGIEYEAISVPKHIYPSIVQSLHIKLQHPSRSQLHKFVHRYFHCTGSTKSVDEIHRLCQICTSLSKVPPPVVSHSTQQVESLGSQFSADVLVSDNQKIFLCREKLSQFLFSRIIQDETAETLRTVILESVLDIMPSTGTTVRVDAAPGLFSIQQALQDLENDDILKKCSVKLEIGRTHNVNKNPIAENCVKEFRKERLRLDPRGGPISEQDRILITKNVNSRIRNRGLSSKEILLRRDHESNNIISIKDSDLSLSQFNKRNLVNDKHNNTATDSPHSFTIGDRIYIISDLSKLRSREEYIVTSLFSKNDEKWAEIMKSEGQFRKKKYSVKLSEIMPVSSNFDPKAVQDSLDDDGDGGLDEEFQGFGTQDNHQTSTELLHKIADLSKSIPNLPGRPKIRYPDYIKETDIFEDLSQDQEPFHGFPTQTMIIDIKVPSPNNVLLHGYIQNLDDESDDEDFFYHALEHQTPNVEDFEETFSTSSHESNDPTDIEDNFEPIVDHAQLHHDDEHLPQQGNEMDDRIGDDNDVDESALSEDTLWWDASANTTLSVFQGAVDHPDEDSNNSRFLSETDPHFLQRKVQLVSTDSSSFNVSDIDDIETDDEIFSAFQESRPVSVSDFTEVLDKLNAIPTDEVVNLDSLPQPTRLPRTSSRLSVRHDYSVLHRHGRTQQH